MPKLGGCLGGKVISAILDQYEALVLYFQSESKTDKIDNAKKIYDTLIDHGTRPIFFLQYILEKVDTLNVDFQSEHFRLHQLFLSVSTEYKNFLSCFIKDEILMTSKLSEVDPNDVSKYKEMKDIYLGGKAMVHLMKNPFKDNAILLRFKSDCLNVLVRLASEIKKRFNFEDESIVAQLRILDPKVASDPSQSPSSIMPLAAHFPTIVDDSHLNKIDDKWRSYRLIASDLTIPQNIIPRYWDSLRDIKDCLNESKFASLSHFMTNLLYYLIRLHVWREFFLKLIVLKQNWLIL